jgi:hypothetical protein
MPTVNEAGFVALAKATGPASGSLLLASFGLYGGQFASKFPAGFQNYAAMLCLLAMLMGIAITGAIVARPVITIWRQK